MCVSKNQTCCTKKMEEKYQLAARRDIQNLLQMSSSNLKFLISSNVVTFQGKQPESVFTQACVGVLPPFLLRASRLFESGLVLGAILESAPHQSEDSGICPSRSSTTL